MIRRLIFGGFFLLSTTAIFAAHDNEWTGTIHNNKDRRLTTLHADGTRFELDFGGLNLYGTAERYDRERASVRGVVTDSASRTGYPRIAVSSITFRPFGSAVTYNISGASSGYYTDYDRNVRRDWYDRDYRYRRNYERPIYRDRSYYR